MLEFIVKNIIFVSFFAIPILIIRFLNRYLFKTDSEDGKQYKEEKESIPDDVINREAEKILESGAKKTPLWATILTIIVLLVIVIYAISILK